MNRRHCDFCDAIIEKFDDKSILGSIEITQYGDGHSTAARIADVFEGAWCSFDHLIEWLQKELEEKP